MTDENIKPSIIKTFYEMMEDLMSYGFRNRDIIHMIQIRTKPKLSITVIKNMLKAIIKFENDFIEFRKLMKINKEVFQSENQ